MHLTTQQAEFLHSLMIVIKEKWDIRIGYTCPVGAFLDPMDEFVIYDDTVPGTDPEDCEWNSQLLYHHDIITDTSDLIVDFNDGETRTKRSLEGVLVKTTPRELLLHEDKVEAFWNRIQSALASGQLSFEPGITRTIDNVIYTVTKKADNRFAVSIKSSGQTRGFWATVAELKEKRSSIVDRDPDRWEEFTARVPKNIVNQMNTEDSRLLIAIQLIEDEWGFDG